MKSQIVQPSPFSLLKPNTWWIVKALFSTCPCCNSLSYSMVERKPGLPCNCCRLPTESILSNVYACKGCNYVHEENYPNGETLEDSMFCDHCTPNHS